MGKEEQLDFDRKSLQSQLERMVKGMNDCIAILPNGEMEWSDTRQRFNVELRSKALAFIETCHFEAQSLIKLTFEEFYQVSTKRMRILYRTYELLYNQFYCQVKRAYFNKEDIARQYLSII